MRNTILEALPCWRGNSYVVCIVNTPVSPCINLLPVIRIHDDRIDRNIRKIAALIRPCERTAVCSARYLKHVTRCCGGVSIKATDSSVAYGQICCPDGRIERNAQYRTQRQNRIVASNIYPVGLCLSAGTKVEPDPDVGV